MNFHTFCGGFLWHLEHLIWSVLWLLQQNLAAVDSCSLLYWFQYLKRACLSTCKFLSGNICALNFMMCCILLVSSANQWTATSSRWCIWLAAYQAYVNFVWHILTTNCLEHVHKIHFELIQEMRFSQCWSVYRSAGWWSCLHASETLCLLNYSFYFTFFFIYFCIFLSNNRQEVVGFF